MYEIEVLNGAYDKCLAFVCDAKCENELQKHYEKLKQNPFEHLRSAPSPPYSLGETISQMRIHTGTTVHYVTVFLVVDVEQEKLFIVDITSNPQIPYTAVS